MDQEKKQLTSSLAFTLKLASIPFIVFLFEFVTGIDLGVLGIYARHVSGVKGIILSPLIHGSLGHLFSNLPPLMVTVFLIHFFYKKNFWGIFLSNYLLTGVLVWLFSREVYHIGISGVVYALVTFLFFTGIFVRNLISIVLSLLVLMMYSGMAAGILPTADILARNISWESHLLGAVAGVVVAWLFRKNIIRSNEKSKPNFGTPSPESKQHFFEPDIFEKTKWQKELDRRQEEQMEIERRKWQQIEMERRQREQNDQGNYGGT